MLIAIREVVSSVVEVAIIVACEGIIVPLICKISVVLVVAFPLVAIVVIIVVVSIVLLIVGVIAVISGIGIAIAILAHVAGVVIALVILLGVGIALQWCSVLWAMLLADLLQVVLHCADLGSQIIIYVV